MSARVRRGSTTSLAANRGQPSNLLSAAYLVDSFVPTAFCLLLYEPLRAAAMDCPQPTAHCPQPSTNHQLGAATTAMPPPFMLCWSSVSRCSRRRSGGAEELQDAPDNAIGPAQRLLQLRSNPGAGLLDEIELELELEPGAPVATPRPAAQGNPSASQLACIASARASWCSHVTANERQAAFILQPFRLLAGLFVLQLDRNTSSTRVSSEAPEIRTFGSECKGRFRPFAQCPLA